MGATRIQVSGGLAALITLGAVLSAQPPQFKTRIDLVTLDVSVVDNRGAPATGLTVEDFVVLEDGKPQSIEVFRPIVVEGRGWRAPWMPQVRQDVATNDAPNGRLLALVLDDALMPAQPDVINAARLAARSLIAQLGPDDAVAVVFTRDSRGAQPFTADRTLLQAAVNRMTIGFAGVPSVNADVTESHFRVGTLQTLESVIKALGAVEHYPRSLVYIGPGFAIDWAEVASPGRVGNLGGVARQQVHQTYASRLRSLLSEAARSHIAVHTIQPSALLSDFHLTLSSNTGGVAIEAVVSTTGGEAHVVREVQRVADASSTVYLLGYRPPPRSAGISRTEVQVRRPGLKVYTRAYLDRKDEERKPPRQALAAPELQAIAGHLPKPGIPLRATAVAVPTSSPRHAVVAIALGVRHTEGPRSPLETVALVANAYDMEGRFRSGHRGRAQVNVSTSAPGAVEYEVYSRLELRPGRYQLRLSADHRTRNVTGSVYVDVDVPDVTAPGFHMSELVLDAGPARLKAAPAGVFATDLPVLPTTQRKFPAGARLAVFTRLSQGGRGPMQPVVVQFRLRDSLGGVVTSHQRTLTADAFRRDRMADYLAGVDTSNLRPGLYLVEVLIESADGRTPRSTATLEIVDR